MWPVVSLLLAARFPEPVTDFLKNIGQLQSMTSQVGGFTDAADFKTIADVAYPDCPGMPTVLARPVFGPQSR